MTLSTIQRNCLLSQGIEIKDELPNGSVICVTESGERIYTAKDLAGIAVPRLMDRFTAFMSKGVAS
ncbi:hypothetical protein J7J47_11990 [Halomonas sp. ISL-60]|uniref:hypothetical protein n=1 Tax=Halomonas sp. ISL-56 TaxID=2819149 RepID=UPI001BE98F89|nr:hypothetical protein [Halomonas sp. ISL-56]MBT2772943.1 hypothetical protein [Halomonas sp. ISL-60]MBT2799990.1 hypothetical protein [Halomonas sp. ISL-56]